MFIGPLQVFFKLEHFGGVVHVSLTVPKGARAEGLIRVGSVDSPKFSHLRPSFRTMRQVLWLSCIEASSGEAGARLRKLRSSVLNEISDFLTLEYHPMKNSGVRAQAQNSTPSRQTSSKKALSRSLEEKSQ
jgi:hypothetical protein